MKATKKKAEDMFAEVADMTTEGPAHQLESIKEVGKVVVWSGSTQVVGSERVESCGGAHPPPACHLEVPSQRLRTANARMVILVYVWNSSINQYSSGLLVFRICCRHCASFTSKHGGVDEISPTPRFCKLTAHSKIWVVREVKEVG